MSVNIWDGEKLVPIAGTGVGGGTEEVEQKLQELESLIEQTRQLRADLESYGMVKLSNATNITDSTGLALPVTEKNPDIEGTLASDISLLKGKTLFRAQAWISGDNKLNSIKIPSTYGVYLICISQNQARPDFECIVFCFLHVEQYSRYTWHEFICGGGSLVNFSVSADYDKSELIIQYENSGGLFASIIYIG